MSKVYFATKDDLNNRVNTVNESINTVQSGIDNLDSTALKTSDLDGLATDENLNAAKSELSAKVDVIEEFIDTLTPQVYQFTINQAESDPASMITYGGKNADYIPAKMNYTTGQFDYGSWKDAFFIKKIKPVVLGYDGSVVSELNPNDYTKTIDGSDSGITSTSLAGNVMVGIPKTYIKTVTSGDTTTVYIADTKLDDDYHCYAHIDYNEQEQDYAYMSAYEGYVYDGKMRSIDGRSPTDSTSADAEVTAAVANNTNTSIKRWYVETYSMRCLLIYLLMLISKSTDSQTSFGKGVSGVSNYSEKINTGTMNTKGLFWGSTDGTSGVKVFGIENFWGNIYNRITGMIVGAGGTALKGKLCWGTSDGSTTKEYNLTGSGYKSYANIPTSGYISKMDFTNGAIVPTAASGSESTYYCDYVNPNASAGTYVAYCGGNCYNRASCGSCCFNSYGAASYSDTLLGSRSIYI